MIRKRRDKSAYLKLKNGNVITTGDCIHSEAETQERNQKIMKTDVYNIFKILFCFSVIGLIIWIVIYFNSGNPIENLQYKEESVLLEDSSEFNENISEIINKINLSEKIENIEEYDEATGVLAVISKNNEIITNTYNKIKVIIIDFIEHDKIRRQSKIELEQLLEETKKYQESFIEESRYFTEFNYITQTVIQRYNKLIEYLEQQAEGLDRNTCVEVYNNQITTDKGLLQNQKNSIIVLLDSKEIEYEVKDEKIIIK